LENTETFLFDKVIFGPVKSRRLGVSLGINLLPIDSKLCNFNCIYCECGWNKIKNRIKIPFLSANDIQSELENSLIQLQLRGITPDVITFAGNGEPTIHPEFHGIIDNTIILRNKYFPNAKVAVLTNATMLNKKNVVDALKKADLRILKLDAGTEEIFQNINQPNSHRSLQWIVDHLQYFNGDLIIQTMFLKGEHNGISIDNTTEANINAWLKLLKTIGPKQVMLYSIDRASAAKKLEKIPQEKLYEIAKRVNELGIGTTVS
jgi:wyosine [tRNA(Phe)-imidazoG37] synthetase (radical SAM superfamily)